MHTIKKVEKVENHQVVIDLPDFDENSEVEVTIVPHPAIKKSTFLKLLLKGPVWSEETVSEFESIINRGYSDWKIRAL